MPALEWADNLGRNGWDTPQRVPANMSVESVNLVLLPGTIGRKRPGVSSVSISGTSWTKVGRFFKYVPQAGLGSAVLLLVTDDGTPAVLHATIAMAFAALTLKDNFNSAPQNASAAQLNNKLFIAYDSGASTNRLHVYDPTNDATHLIRVGLKTSAAPTAADTGSGSYAATERWYAVIWRAKAGSIVLRQSERSPGVDFTPSGSGTAARVTKPTNPGETETHWVVMASNIGINGPYYELSEIVIGTTTYDDSADPASYSATGVAEPEIGQFLPFPSVKYLATDGVHLFGLGVWATSAGDSITPVPGRVYFTPALGTTNHGDDERLPNSVTQSNWIDLDPNGGSGGEDRGIAGPLNNEIYAFKAKGIYRLIPTGQVLAPFKRIVLSKTVGAVSHQSIVSAEDESGIAQLYFLDPATGPWRTGVGAELQWLGRDIWDLWRTFNINATHVTAWGEFDPIYRRIMWWIATGSANDPALVIVFDCATGKVTEASIVRYGWTQWTGLPASFISGVMFPRASGDVREALYGSAGSGAIQKLTDDFGTVATDDPGTVAYGAYALSKAYTEPDGISRKKRLTESYVTSTAGKNVEQTLIKDRGAESSTLEAITPTALGSEPSVRARFETTDMADATFIQAKLGDTTMPNTAPFTIETWEGIIEDTEAK